MDAEEGGVGELYSYDVEDFVVNMCKARKRQGGNEVHVTSAKLEGAMDDFSPLVHVEIMLLSEQTSCVQNPQEVFERKGMDFAVFQKVKKERQDSEDLQEQQGLNG